MSTQTILRTRIYVDGYNFYYGCLKRTPYKWLNLDHLFKKILQSTLLEIDGLPAKFEPAGQFVNFFTAPILPKFARADDSVKCQADYHIALKQYLKDSMEIIEGRYDSIPARAHRHINGTQPAASEVVEIWKLEEKKSDVALAIRAYGDALKGEIDHAVLASNDTDLVPAMEAIRRDTDVKVGLIIPTRNSERPATADLDNLSHWTRRNVKDEELEECQLPTPIRINQNKVIHKPLSWYPRPDLLNPIFQEAKRVKGSTGAAWKWLNTESEHLDYRKPIDLTTNDDLAKELIQYMDNYAIQFAPKVD